MIEGYFGKDDKTKKKMLEEQKKHSLSMYGFDSVKKLDEEVKERFNAISEIIKDNQQGLVNEHYATDFIMENTTAIQEVLYLKNMLV